MDIHIQKDTTVSLHRQLVTQIAMQITSGLLKPGAKLPSIRSLSQRLNIHHNTCLAAYRELDEVGLVELRHGSGARVVQADDASRGSGAHPGAELSDLQTLAAFFVRQTTSKGISWSEALAALEAARRDLGEAVRRPLVFVDLHADVLPLFRAELQEALGRPVGAMTLDQLDPATEAETHFVVSRYHVQALRDRLAQGLRARVADGIAGLPRGVAEKSGGKLSESASRLEERITVVDLGSGQPELAMIRELSDASLVAVFSQSSIVLAQAEAVVKALRGDGIYLRTVQPAQETSAEIQRILKRAHLIFADALCAPELRTLTRKPIHPIRVIPEPELAKLTPFRMEGR